MKSLRILAPQMVRNGALKALSVAWLAALAASMPSLAAPVLSGNQFYGVGAFASASDWQYTGTLPSAVNAGFRLKNIDDDFFGDSGNQYSNGSRMATTTVGANPTYSLKLTGNYQHAVSTLWEGNLLAQSQGNVQSDDIDDKSFQAPSGGAANEHPIPTAWQSTYGYASPTGAFAQFSRTYTPRTYLYPGENDCPAYLSPGGGRADLCLFKGAYFKGGADLSASLTGYADVHEVGSETVTVLAKADRITTLKVNGDPLYSSSVTGSASSFSLQEDELSSLSFNFNITDGGVSGSVGAAWTTRDDVGSMDASYAHRMVMDDYQNVGKATSYLVELRDTPSMTAGIVGSDFVEASVGASVALSGLDSVLLPVYEPVAAGRLVVQAAYGLPGLEKDAQLRIPAGGFVGGLAGALDLWLSNIGGLELTVDGFDFKLLDVDPFFDDELLNLSEAIGLRIFPGQTINLGRYFGIGRKALNDANDGLEMGGLDLSGLGTVSYHDIYGSRSLTYTAAAPEPGSLALCALALVGLLVAGRPGSVRKPVKGHIRH